MEIFSRVLNMSITASIIILLVLIVRGCIKKLPKVYSYVLWGAVLFRLLCPVSLSMPVSVLSFFSPISNYSSVGNASEVTYLPDSIAKSAAAAGDDAKAFSANDISVGYDNDAGTLESSPSSNVNSTIVAGNVNASDNVSSLKADEHTYSPKDSNTVAMSSASASVQEADADNTQRTAKLELSSISAGSIVVIVWVAGMLAMLIYAAADSIRLRGRLSTACVVEGNIYESENITGAFVAGLLRPKIYLPLHLKPNVAEAIVMHERVHLRRGDYIFKALGYFALSLHWFNPLAWVAFILACADMEKSCDEAVLRGMMKSVDSKQAKVSYSQILLAMSCKSLNNRLYAVSFAQTDVKKRIHNVVNFKQLKKYISVGICMLMVLLIGGCVFNPIITAPLTIGDLVEFSSVRQVYSDVPDDCVFPDCFVCKTVYSDNTFAAGGSKVEGISITGVIASDDYNDIYLRNVVIPRNDTIRQECKNESTRDPKGTCVHKRNLCEEPLDVIAISSNAFYGQQAVETVEIPDTVEKIYSSAFANCKSLRSVYLPEYGITEISESTFRNCTSMEAISLPKTVRSIYYGAFAGCESLREIVLPESLREIAPDAFEGCSITIYALHEPSYYSYAPTTGVDWIVPESVGKDNISAFTFDRDSKYTPLYSEVPDGCVFDDGLSCQTIYSLNEFDCQYVSGISIIGYNPYFVAGQNTKPLELVIPRDDSVRQCCQNFHIDCVHNRLGYTAQVVEIAPCAFYSCSFLRTVTIPDTVTEIRRSAFENCNSLNAVYLPKYGLTEIADSTFRNCTALDTIALPVTIERIGGSAFENCESLDEIFLPESVKEIAPDAFKGCDIEIHAPHYASYYGYTPDSGVKWVASVF